MKILIDMNLSPKWVEVLERNGYFAAHWSSIGDPRAKDQTIIDWAKSNDYIIFTHDLDFGALLAVTGAQGPSVIQIRTQDVGPHHLEKIVISALKQYQSLLEEGALIIVDENKLRARILPFNH
jgi:predicted nuclease of predicted toxin-antitoxin system